MIITLNRQQKNLRGTNWRPIERTFWQRRSVEAMRTRTDGVEIPMRRIQDLSLSGVDMILAGGNGHTYARVEDVYRRGKFLGGFVYLKALGVLAHEQEVERVEALEEDQIGFGAIIGRGVRIEEGAKIGSYVELEAGATLKKDAIIGDSSVIRKRSVIGRGVQIGAHAYVGQFSNIHDGSKIGSMSKLDKQFTQGWGSEIGRQCLIGKKSTIGVEACLGDSVQIGSHGFVGDYTMIGEMTRMGNNCHIGNSSVVGAESVFGNIVRVARGVYLSSPTYAADGEFIMQSNLAITGISLRFHNQQV